MPRGPGSSSKLRKVAAVLVAAAIAGGAAMLSVSDVRMEFFLVTGLIDAC